MAKASGKADRGWFPVGVLAEIFGVTTQAFHQTYRPLIPSTAVREKGRTTEINARAAIDAWVNHQLSKQRVASGDEDSALLYADSDSPNLERLRAAKADREEMARDRDRGTHADINDLHVALARYGNALRRGGEVMQRRFGPDAADVFNGVLTKAEDELRRSLPSPAGPDQPEVQSVAGGGDSASDGGGEDPPAPKHSRVRRK